MGATDWSYEEALRAVMARSDFERGHVTSPFIDAAAGERGLRRMAALLEHLERPQTRYGIIHVAGSKGKGSTSAMVAAVLNQAGYTTGLFTSPHLHSIRERIVVAGDPVSQTAFAASARRVVEAAERVEADTQELGRITTFELLTAIGFEHFAIAACDFAVIEVGLGGQYDATNVVTPLVAVITRLDLEHVAVLGDSLAEIATAKAGIIKPGRPVVISPQEEPALEVILATAGARSSPLLVGGRDWRWTGSWRQFTASGPWGDYHDLQLGLPGSHQVENGCTALAALWVLHEQGVELSATAIREGLAGVRWSGRFERVTRDGQPSIILDGAHTPRAAAALATTLADEWPGVRPIIVLGMLRDKNMLGVAEALGSVAARFVATRPDHPRAADPVAVADVISEMGFTVEIQTDPAEALARALELAGESGLVVVTGSLATVSAAREALGLAVRESAIV